MYAGSDPPAWPAPGPGRGPEPALGPQPSRRLGLLLAVVLLPLTAGVLTGIAVPLVLALQPDAGWAQLGPASLAALLLSAPAAHGLAALLLRSMRGP
jgi:hypothetical protein